MGNFIRQIHVDGKRNGSMWSEYDPEPNSASSGYAAPNGPTETRPDPSAQRDPVKCIWRCNGGFSDQDGLIFCVGPGFEWELAGVPMSRDHRDPAFLQRCQISR